MSELSFHGIAPTRIQALLAQERASYAQRHPRSQALAAAASQHLMFGVPLHWMSDWGTPFALHVEQAQGARLHDVDGHALVDFCLGDTGAMFGHSPPVVAEALSQRATRGLTAMLPSEDAAAVGAGAVVLDALAIEPRADFEIRHQRCAGGLQDLKRVTHMVAMAVGEQQVGETLARLLPAGLGRRISGEERVDQDDRAAGLDAEGRMAVIGNLHCKALLWECDVSSGAGGLARRGNTVPSRASFTLPRPDRGILFQCREKGSPGRARRR